MKNNIDIKEGINWTRCILLCFYLLCFPADSLAVGVLSSSNHIFSGRPTEIPIDIARNESTDHQLVWQFFIQGRRVASGQKAIDPGMLKTPPVITIDVPPLKSSLIVEAQLKLLILKSAGQDIVAQHTEPFLLYSPHLYDGRKSWLKNKNIVVFDPGGVTIDNLSKLEIPFNKMDRMESIAHMSSGLLIIGEGLELDGHRNLEKLAVEAASRGVGVLFLASLNAHIPLPGFQDAGSHQVSSIQFWTRDIFDQLSPVKKFNVRPALGDEQGPGLLVSHNRADEYYALSSNENGWPWLEIRFRNSRSKFIYLGVSMFSKWEESPIQRYYLFEIIKYITEEQSS